MRRVVWCPDRTDAFFHRRREIRRKLMKYLIAITTLDAARLAKQLFCLCFFLAPHNFVKMRRVSVSGASHYRGHQPSRRTGARRLSTRGSYGHPAPTFTNRVLGGAKRAGLRGPQHWAPGRASRDASRPNRGLPAGAPCRPEGVAPKPESGLPERPRTRAEGRKSCRPRTTPKEQKRRCSSTSPRRSPSPTASSSTRSRGTPTTAGSRPAAPTGC